MAADEGLKKLAAILVADVTGFSGSMAHDDRTKVRALTEYRGVISEHVETRQGGMLDTTGDVLGVPWKRGRGQCHRWFA